MIATSIYDYNKQQEPLVENKQKPTGTVYTIYSQPQ